MPFLFTLDNTEVHGTIDLLLQGPDGLWELVDYKSAAPAVGAPGALVDKHSLQLGIYALAAGRWLGQPVARQSVYVLDTDSADPQEISEADLARAEARVRQALAGMAAEQYDCRSVDDCPRCRFNGLCNIGPMGVP